jgi:hypothetical protein
MGKCEIIDLCAGAGTKRKDALYHRRDFLEGMREAREAGIGAFEFWSWWLLPGMRSASRRSLRGEAEKESGKK